MLGCCNCLVNCLVVVEIQTILLCCKVTLSFLMFELNICWDCDYLSSLKNQYNMFFKMVRFCSRIMVRWWHDALGGEGRRSWRAGGHRCGGAAESLVMCSTGAVGVDDDDHEKEDSDEERIEIGQPTDVPHVSHITYDRFDGFLGLPVDLEPDVPRRTPSARWARHCRVVRMIKRWLPFLSLGFFPWFVVLCALIFRLLPWWNCSFLMKWALAKHTAWKMVCY